MAEIVENWEEKSFPLVEAFKELKAAHDARCRLVEIGVGRFHDYDRAWRDFVLSIDRVWNKTQAEAKGRKNWAQRRRSNTLRANTY